MNSLNIEIRPVTPPDVPAIALLAREIWQATYPGIITQEQIDFMLEQRYGHERLYDDLEDADKWLDQAFHQGRRVGFAFSEIRKGEFKLDKLYIHPDVQRRGVDVDQHFQHVPVAPVCRIGREDPASAHDRSET